MKILSYFLLSVFLVFFCCSIVSASGTITVSPSNTNSNQDIINDAINSTAESGGGTVYLNSGVYFVDNTVVMKSGIKLKGDSNAIIRVSPSSSQWFTGSTGIISCKESVQNVEICGFQIDGNIEALPSNFANTPGHDKDCEKLIILHGDSGNYAHNIRIHDVKLYNSFSDGIYIYYARNVAVYKNFISNCQHEGVFFSVVIGGYLFSNQIAGITSDCARIDNSINCVVNDNVFFSYDGDNTNGAYKHGENGIQVGDAGSSHGYDASNKPTTTTNIEIYGNTFANNGLKAIAGSGGENVYIHENKFIGVAELETMGIPVGDISENNMPTVEMSEHIFSIFDILKTEISETGYVEQGNVNAIDPEWEQDRKAEAYIYLVGYEGQISIWNETYIPKAPSKCAKIITDTQNLASHPVDQTSTLVLKDEPNGSLKAVLKVKTKYTIITHKTVSIGDASITVPSFKEKTEHETFTKVFPAPKVYPVTGPEDIEVNVNYQNNSLNPHTTIEIKLKNSTGGDITGAYYNSNGSEAREYRLIGYVNESVNGFKTSKFKRTNTWKFSDDKMSYSYHSLYIKGPFDINKLKINVKTPYDDLEITKFNYTEAGDPLYIPINPAPFVIILVLIIIIRPFLMDIKNSFGRMR